MELKRVGIMGEKVFAFDVGKASLHLYQLAERIGLKMTYLTMNFHLTFFVYEGEVYHIEWARLIGQPRLMRVTDGQVFF